MDRKETEKTEEEPKVEAETEVIKPEEESEVEAEKETVKPKEESKVEKNVIEKNQVDSDKTENKTGIDSIISNEIQDNVFMNSEEVIDESPTFTRTLEIGIPSSAIIFSTAGRTSFSASSILEAKIASFGCSPSYFLSPYLLQKSLMISDRNSSLLTFS